MNRKPINVWAFGAVAFLFLTVLSSAIGADDLTELALVKPGRSRAVTSADPNPNSNKDRIGVVAPRETKVLADIKSQGVIRHIWLTFNEARPN